MKYIDIDKNYRTKIDDNDYEIYSKYKWSKEKFGSKKGYIYVVRKVKTKRIWLHKEILGAKNNQIVDHIDGDTLNNQRDNLRLCSKFENNRNRKKSLNKSSRYKGVYFNKDLNKWRSQICVNKKLIELGCFINEIDAAIAYNNAAKQYHGEFAKMNIL